MKKIALVLAVILIIVFPVMANNTYSVGINAGTTPGLHINYDTKTLNYFGTLGYGFYSNSIATEIGAETKITDFSIDKADFVVNGGGMIGLSARTSYFGLNLMGCASVYYDFEDIPFTIYLRSGIGVGLEFYGDAIHPGLTGSGAIGFMYRLEDKDSIKDIFK